MWIFIFFVNFYIFLWFLNFLWFFKFFAIFIFSLCSLGLFSPRGSIVDTYTPHEKIVGNTQQMNFICYGVGYVLSRRQPTRNCYACKIFIKEMIHISVSKGIEVFRCSVFLNDIWYVLRTYSLITTRPPLDNLIII